MSKHAFTKYACIDTSVFRKTNYRFESKQYEKVSELCKSNDLRLVMPEVVLREVYEDLREFIVEAKQKLDQFQTKGRFLSQIEDSDIKGLLDYNFDIELYHNRLKSKFDDFIKPLATICTLEQSSVRSVFDSYFQRTGAFSHGKRKAEFPDAFLLSSLEYWARESKEKVYVLSLDKQLLAGCEGALLPLEGDLSTLIDIFTHNEEVIMKLWDIISYNEDRFIGLTQEQLEDHYIEVEDQEDGEVLEVRVQGISVARITLIDYSDPKYRFDLDFDVSIEADLKFPDPSTSWYDKESGRWFWIGEETETVTRDIYLTFEVEFVLDEEQIEIDGIERFSMEDRYISVASSYDAAAEEYWK